MALVIVFCVLLVGSMFCNFAGVFIRALTFYRYWLCGAGCVCALVCLGIMWKMDFLFVESAGFPPWCNLTFICIALVIVFPIEVIIKRRA